MKRTGEMWLYETSLNVWEEHVDEKGMFPVFRKVIASLRKRGFTVRQDPNTLKNYPTLARTHWVGRKGDLEFKIELSGMHLQLEFFQNVVSGGNRHGGRYDFGKSRLMPLRMRLVFITEMTAAVRLLSAIGYVLREDGHHHVPLPLTPLAIRDAAARALHTTPLARFNANWGASRFDRDASGWPSDRELRSWPYPDRTGRAVRTGDTKYLRHKGRIQRCTVWPNMNGMWQACFGDQVRYVGTGDLFECERPDLEPRRLVPGQIERLQKELLNASEAKQWRRVAALGVVLDRLTADAARAA